MGDNDYVEKRKYRRVNVSIPIKYREISHDEIIAPKKVLKTSECINISRGGMQILTDRPWPRSGDKLIETEFIMSGRVLRLIAHIARSGFDSRLKKFRTGLEFIAIKSGDLEIIGQIA